MYLNKIKALDFAHCQGIMHRDVKLKNLIIESDTNNVRLIDWGLAEFFYPNFEYSLRVGTKPYKAPELLLGYNKYDYSLDLWSLGCIFASAVNNICYFFICNLSFNLILNK